MTLINLSYKLTPVAATGATLEEIRIELLEQLLQARQSQQEGLVLNQTTDCTKKTKFSNVAARELKLPVDIWVPKSSYAWNEMMRSEIYRILSTWQQRCQIAEVLEKSNWELEYKDRPESIKYVKRTQFENIKRSKIIPALPTITKPRITLAKASTQYSALEQFGQYARLYLSLNEREVALDFKIPDKVWKRYPKAKLSRPTIELDGEEIIYNFSLQWEVIPTKSTDTVTAFDLGVSKAFSGASLSANGTVELTRGLSLESSRVDKKIKILDDKIRVLAAKNKRRKLLNTENTHAIIEETRLRAKRARSIESLSWQLAHDMLEYAGDSSIVLEKLTWGQGGPVKFKHSLMTQKLDHVAAKRGKKVKKVNPAFSSRECGKCLARLSPDSSRLSTCESCGFSLDRDDMAAIVLARRASTKVKKIRLKKSGPTRKQVKPRKKVVRIPVKQSGFTGPRLDSRTENIEDIFARLLAEYSEPQGSVYAGWRKRSENW